MKHQRREIEGSKDCRIMRAQRERETSQERQKRLCKMQDNVRAQRVNETSEQREQRLHELLQLAQLH